MKRTMDTAVYALLVCISMCSISVISGAGVPSTTEKPKESCEDDDSCFNGGSCVEHEGNKFCECPTGTEGHFCETDVACKGMDCGTDAECQRIGENKVPTCMCKKETLVFDKRERSCKETCDEDEKKCLNGGKCETRDDFKFCDCPKGTEGSFCQLYNACKGLNCGDEAKCEVDDKKEVAACTCEEKTLSFDGKDKKCKETCGDDKKCLNGGKCEARNGGKFCDCVNGTEGFFCQLHTACKKMDCGSDAKCFLDGDKAIAICRCKKSALTFDEEDKKCKGQKVRLSSLSVFAIAFTVIICTIMIVAAIVYRRRKNSAAGPRYTMRFRDQYMTFESALYDANTETMEFDDKTRH